MKQILFLLLILSLMLNASIVRELKLSKNDIFKIKNSKNKVYIFNRLNNFKRLKKELKFEKNQIIKITKINNFFNKFTSQSDKKNYNKIDYWASRKEFLLKGKGDCEDYVIAKYFTLLEVGIKKRSLSLIQVEYKKKLHLVLSYKKDNQYLILDNINKKILNLNDRKDLSTLYKIQSFNVKKEKLTSSNKLILFKWNALLDRLGH